MWKSDFMHARLADGGDVEVLSWLDDHSRFLLPCTAHQPVTGDTIVATFLATIEDHGPPASTLTDNGRVYTARFGGGRNDIRIPTADPRDPAEERLARPPTNPRQDRTIPPDPATLARRPTSRQHPSRAAEPTRHVPRALQRASPSPRTRRRTPANAYRATPKALPARPRPQAHYRLRYDRLDKKGTMTLRRGGRMHHLGVGAAHTGKRVLALADEHHITVTELDTGEILPTPPHPTPQDLLAQPTTRTRPLAELSQTRPMTRLGSRDT